MRRSSSQKGNVESGKDERDATYRQGRWKSSRQKGSQPTHFERLMSMRERERERKK